MLQIEFLTALLAEKNPSAAIESGITDQWFDAENARVYRFISGYWRKHREMPTLRAVQRDCPGFQPIKTSEPYGYHAEQLRNDYQRRLMQDALSRASLADDTERPISTSASELHARVMEIMRVGAHTSDHEWNGPKESAARWEDYQLVSKGGGMRGIPTPWGDLNRELLGLQSKHLIVVAARPGTGKTWYACILAHHAARMHGKKCLVVSKEMTESELGRRLDSLDLKLSAKLLRRGALSKADADRYRKHLLTPSKKMAGRIIVVTDDAIGEKTGTAVIRAKLETWQPDFLVVDGAYLLRNRPDANKTADLYDVSQDLKRIAREFDIPIVATIQMARAQNEREARTGGSLAKLQWADAWGQDADEVMELFQTDAMKADRRMRSRLLKQREGELLELEHNWDFEKMDFSVIRSDSGSGGGGGGSDNRETFQS